MKTPANDCNFSIHKNENEIIKFYRLPADAYFKELCKSFQEYLFLQNVECSVYLDEYFAMKYLNNKSP